MPDRLDIPPKPAKAKPAIQELTYEQKQELTKEDWVRIEAKYRKQINRVLRKGNTAPREMADLVRGAAVAHDMAYPDSALSGLAVIPPAKLLKPIEQAILSASNKSHRESFSKPSEDSGKTRKVEQSKTGKLT